MQMDQRDRCFDLKMEQNQDHAVSNPKPAEVQAYQYYEKGEEIYDSSDKAPSDAAVVWEPGSGTNVAVPTYLPYVFEVLLASFVVISLTCPKV